MNTNEWPLVFFTILAQAGAGMVVVLLVVTLLFRNQGIASSDDIRKGIILMAAVLTGLALLTSFLHLGRPAHAVYAASGFGTSWLSREIVMASIYFALLAATWTVSRYTDNAQTLFPGWLFLLAAAGLFTIYTMIRLYMLPTIPVWNNASTPVAFLNTALLLGPALFLAAILLFFRTAIDPASVKPVVTLIMVLILAGIVIHVLNATLLIPKEISPDAAFAPPAIPVIWHIARWFFLFVGLALLLVWYGMFRQNDHIEGSWMVYTGASGLIVAELLARYLFYASYYRIGV